MVTTLFTAPTKTFTCKQLDRLPPVVTDWQQCQQPRCSHYCAGECCNSGRQSVSAPCPFDGKKLPLVDAGAVFTDFSESSVATRPLPKKG
jgi:hypothetical protein